MSPHTYRIPAATRRVEETIRGSRFIATIGHAPTPETAREFITGIQNEFPSATHNCWAFQAGPPGDGRILGMSDDGEPHGTAGQPMLNVLTHSDIGEVVVVVTRYFGGIKLGRGGLVRAYSGMVKRAAADLICREIVPMSAVEVNVDYAWVSIIERAAALFNLEPMDRIFGDTMVARFHLPENRLDDFRQWLLEQTRGSAKIRLKSADEKW